MRLEEVNRLLDPAPLQLEMGYERMPDGSFHAAVRTDMHGVTGEQFEWWFRSRPDTERYIWWHPIDHVFSEWKGGDSSTHVGSMHVITEEFSGMPATDLRVQFRDNSEFFDQAQYDKARAEGRISASVCGRLALGWEGNTTPDGSLLGGRLLHIGRDTEWGMVLRSHFFVGGDYPAMGLNPEQVEEMFPDPFAQALVQHAYDEFTFLSRFLPHYHAASHRDTKRPANPW